MKRTSLSFGLALLSLGAFTLFATSCGNSKGKGESDKTGWNYNDKDLGGFSVPNYPGQVTGPGLVFVEGGRFTMGQTEEDVAQYRNNIPRTVSVGSFYMDETEVANVHYREYTYWMERAYGSDYPELMAAVRPDSTAWRTALSYNEPQVQYYFRHAAFNFYPVVGVSWHQANEYCKWRSDRVNEMILIKDRKLEKNPFQTGEDVFTTESYVADQYEGLAGKKKRRDLDPTGTEQRNDRYYDGMLLPNYRLPTEAEWEFAALALISENPEPSNKRRRGEEALVNRKNYPWGDPRSTRYMEGGRSDNQGQYMGNYQRGRGDAAGVPGGLNDDALYPAPINSYYPNALGLYNMAGNVSEWTLDTYRPTSHQDVADVNPYRGNYYIKPLLDSEGLPSEKDTLGRMQYVPIDSTDVAQFYDRDYADADARDYKDGDPNSGFVYDYGVSSRVNNETKVIKGASWKDRAIWLSPGTRRPMQANHTSAQVGFRCVMDRLGSMGGNVDRGGNYFPTSKSNRKK